MLINLSNHPFNKWENSQYETAKSVYKTIVDMPFPMIDAKASQKDIQDLASTYVGKLKVHIDNENEQNSAVHLMGEQTFCYALVTLLKKEGIKVIASTTERNVVDLGNGKKETQFKFIQFREY